MGIDYAGPNIGSSLRCCRIAKLHGDAKKRCDTFWPAPAVRSAVAASGAASPPHSIQFRIGDRDGQEVVPLPRLTSTVDKTFDDGGYV